MRPAELIIKKRNQQELNPQEINEFVRMVVDGTISDAQIGILIPHHYHLERKKKLFFLYPDKLITK